MQTSIVRIIRLVAFVMFNCERMEYVDTTIIVRLNNSDYKSDDDLT